MEPRIIKVEEDELVYKDVVLVVVSKLLWFNSTIRYMFPDALKYAKVHMSKLLPKVLRYEYKGKVLYICVVKFDGIPPNRLPVDYQVEDAFKQVAAIAKEKGDYEIFY